MEREIIILATSAKFQNSCVGGIDAKTGEWIRLVSDNETIGGALTQEMLTYKNGVQCSPLDKIRVSVVKKVPIAHQPENFLVDITRKFEKIERVSLEDVLEIHQIENGSINVDDFFRNNLPYFDSKEILEIKKSLALIEVKNLKIYRNIWNKLKVSFEYLETLYNEISMTDPEYFFINSNLKYNKAIVMLSLGSKPFEQNSNYYKYVVKIFPLYDKSLFLKDFDLGNIDDEFPF